MESYAIVQASGKQFFIEENKFYDFDKLRILVKIPVSYTHLTLPTNREV